MTTTIALAGKGGTGKTTLAGLLIRYLTQHHLGRVLAIDADPSSNLHLVLGMELARTVGDIREDARDKVPPGIPRPEWMDYTIRMAVEEGDAFDFLAMGRPEGPGCYCAPNHMLRSVMDAICKTYDFVVMDNEAGMEHLSRRTTRDVDHLLLVSDASMRGLVAVEAMLALVPSLNIHIRNTHLILNRVVGAVPDALEQKIETLGVPLLAVIPYDALLAEFDSDGRALVELPDDAPSSRAVQAIAERLVAAQEQAVRLQTA